MRVVSAGLRAGGGLKQERGGDMHQSVEGFRWPSGRRRIETRSRSQSAQTRCRFRWPSGRRRIETLTAGGIPCPWIGVSAGLRAGGGLKLFRHGDRKEFPFGFRWPSGRRRIETLHQPSRRTGRRVFLALPRRIETTTRLASAAGLQVSAGLRAGGGLKPIGSGDALGGCGFRWPSGRRRIETSSSTMSVRLRWGFRWPSGRRRIETTSKPGMVRMDGEFPLAFGPAAD